MEGNFKKIYFFVLIFFFSACAIFSPGPQKDPLTGKIAPEWIRKSGSAFSGDGGKYIYGVGVASKSGNFGATKEKAEHRSRIAVSRSIKTYVSSLIKDFMQDFPDYIESSKGNSREYVEVISKEVGESVLNGVIVIDAWEHPDGNYYVLSRIEKNFADEAMKKQLANADKILTKERAEEALKQLDKEIAKVDLQNEKQANRLLKSAE